MNAINTLAITVINVAAAAVVSCCALAVYKDMKEKGKI